MFLEWARQGTPCPICGGEESALAIVVHGFPYRQCLGCTHVYNAEKIPPERLEQYYSDPSISEFPYSATYSEDEEVQKIRFQESATRKVDYVCGFLGGMATTNPGEGRCWIDIACGNGDALAVAKQRGFQVTGIEISPSLVEHARRHNNIEVYQGTLLDYYRTKGKEVKYDVVSFLGILDALPDALTYLRIARDMASDGGFLVANVPHYNSLSTALQQSFKDQATRHACPNIFHLFTEQSFRRPHGEPGLSLWRCGSTAWIFMN